GGRHAQHGLFLGGGEVRAERVRATPAGGGAGGHDGRDCLPRGAAASRGTAKRGRRGGLSTAPDARAAAWGGLAPPPRQCQSINPNGDPTMMRKSGVYIIRHLPTGTVYVGSSRDIAARGKWQESERHRGRYANRRLQADWLRDGPTAFVWERVAAVEP